MAQPKQQSIVTDFVERLVAEHEEPLRRGEGPSKAKVRAAALLALTTKTASEVAKEIDTTGYVVRNWLQEESFRRLMERITRDFGKFFWEVGSDEESLRNLLLNPAAEVAILEELQRLEPMKDHEWVRVANSLIKSLLDAKTQKLEVSEWVKSRALRNTEHMMKYLAQPSELNQDPLEEAHRLLRERIHKEIEKYLPEGEEGSTARSLLAVLSGRERLSR